MTKLVVMDCPKLTYVDCSYNDLTDLDLSNQYLLERLICNNNSLMTLNVSFDQQLVYINCRFNMLFDLIAQACPNLKMVASEMNY